LSIAPLGLYVHIPFCASKCAYCDFNSYVGLEPLFADYVGAVEAEIAAAGERTHHPRVHTIYLGGGTPTLLPTELLGKILAACHRAFDVAPDAEVSCEANPGSADRRRFVGLRRLGVNRLSLGVQSFADGELRLLRRCHTADVGEAAFRDARRAGFDNVGLDLIFGLPGQLRTIWQATLERAIVLRPDHLSLYCLSVEEETPLAEWISDGRVASPDDDLAADLYGLACDLLASAGYVHYEISNWALDASPVTDLNPSMACRHNLATWRNEPFLGFGAGAHSGLDTARWWNVSAPAAYIERLQAGESPVAGSEEIDESLAMDETMMLGLRLVQEGVPRARFQRRFGHSLLQVYPKEIVTLEMAGLLEQLPDRIRLSERGRLLANEVFGRFLRS
jgi:oxygen-independent coproporphyrinogen-3 oxidase